MTYPRQFLNEVLLPNGDVIAIGGNTNGQKFSDDFAILNPEAWDRDTGLWTLMNPQDQARTYHSTAVLMLDGRVFSAGGGLFNESCPGTGSPGECGVDHWNAEIFSPPYLFASDGSPAIRPVIQSLPGVARLGRTIRVHATPGLSAFSLIRMSGTTHTMNTDQRYLRPSFVEVSPGQYDVTLHTNEHVMVPGYWMLFAMDGEVPSIARAIHIVNDGVPRGPPISSRQNDVGDTVLLDLELEDPDGNPLSYFATDLPTGLSLGASTGVITGTTTAAGLFNVQILALDGVDAVNIDFPWIVSSVRSEVRDRVRERLDTRRLRELLRAARRRRGTRFVQRPRARHGPDPQRHLDGLRDARRGVALPARWHARCRGRVVPRRRGRRVPAERRQHAGRGHRAGHRRSQPLDPALHALGFATPPAVIAQVSTTSAGAGSPPTTVRIDAVTTDGFTVLLQQQEVDGTAGNPPVVPAEDVHWVRLRADRHPGRAGRAFQRSGSTRTRLPSPSARASRRRPTSSPTPRRRSTSIPAPCGSTTPRPPAST